MTNPEDAPTTPAPVNPKPGPAPAAPAPAPAKPRMKRWKKILLITGGIFAGLILVILLVGPAIIGSVAQSKIPAILAEELGATATVGNVSFSWSGHLQIDDFRLVPKNFTEPLVDVKKVDVKVSLASALGGKYIAEVEVVDPKIVVEKGADGKFNYDFPENPRAPKKPREKKDGAKDKKEKGPPPYVQANLRVRGGEVTVRGRGHETQYRNLALDARVDTLEKPVEYSLSLESPAKDQLKVKGGFDVSTQSGPATVRLERLSLRNLTGAARAYSDIVDLDGVVDGAIQYEIKGGRRIAGWTKLELTGFSASFLKGDPVKLERLTLTHDGAIDEKGNGRHVIVLSTGKAVTATITADVTDAFGARVVKTDLKVDTDLAALGDLLRGVGAMPPNLKMAGAVTVRGTCDSKGPSQADLDANKLRVGAQVDVELAVTNLEMIQDGKPMKLDRLIVHHTGTVDEDGNGKNAITVSSGRALSAEVRVDVTDVMGKTPLVKGNAKVNSDLGELGKMLEKLIGLKPDLALEGSVGIKGGFEAKGADSASASFELAALDLAAVDAKEKKRLEIDKSILLKLAGGWDGKTKTVRADVLKLESAFATLDGNGGASLAGESPEIRETKIRLDADLEKLASKLKSFMQEPPVLGGKISLAATALGEKMGVDVALKDIRYGSYGPIEATLKHEGTLDKQGRGRQTIRLESGKAIAMTVTADVKDAYKDARAVAADLKLDSDLAALSAMLPGVIELKPGTTLAGTVGMTARAEAKGSTWARFEAAANVDNLEAVDKGKRQEIDKAIRFKAAGQWDGAKKAASLDSLTLTSSFASADGKGGVSLAEPLTVRESSFQLKADLSALGAKLGLFMADAPGLAGTLTAGASYAGDKYALDAAATGVKITTKKTAKEDGREAAKIQVIGPIDATVAQKGTFSTAKGGGFRIETGVVTSSAADLKLSGEIRKVLEPDREGEIRLEAIARPVELAKWMPDLNLGGKPLKFSGVVSLKPRLITVTGQTQVEELTLTSKEPGSTAPVTQTAKTGAVTFSVTMKDADLLASLKVPSFEWIDKGYSAKGGLDAEVTYNDKGTTGTTKLTALEIADDKKNVVKDPGLTLVHDIGLSENPRTVDLRRVEVTATFLRGTVTGKMTGLDKSPEFQKVHAAFRYIPDKLAAVLKPWLPGTLEGADEKTLDVTLDGKAAAADALAILRGTQGGVEVDLARFTTGTGLSLSGKTRLDLKDGKLVSGTPLVVNKGRTDLDASIDFRKPEDKPQSRITFNAKDVDANGQMGPILEKINPIFHTSGVDAKVDGQIRSDFNLAWDGAIDPGEKDWVGAASKSLSGGGLFGVKGLSIEGSPTVKDLTAALGLGGALQGELVATQIRIEKGECRYENMTLRGSKKDAAALQRDQDKLKSEKQQLEDDKPHLTPKEYAKRQEELKLKEDDLPYRYVLRFTGFVKFNKEMKLRVLMPMSENLAKAHPHLSRYIGTSFWVDLTGTVDHPTLDTKKMVAEAIKRAAEGLLKDKASDLLGGLLGDKKRESEAEKMFNDAQKAETAKDAAKATQLYQKLLKTYDDTDFVKKRKSAIEDRLKALK